MQLVSFYLCQIFNVLLTWYFAYSQSFAKYDVTAFGSLLRNSLVCSYLFKWWNISMMGPCDWVESLGLHTRTDRELTIYEWPGSREVMSVTVLVFSSHLVQVKIAFPSKRWIHSASGGWKGRPGSEYRDSWLSYPDWPKSDHSLCAL